MVYYVYMNCDENSFYLLKKELEFIRNLILKTSDRLQDRFRHDDSDYITLNFNIVDNSGCNGTFGIAFEDLPENETFRIAFTKSIDLNQFRYGIMKNLREKIPLNRIKNEVPLIINELFKDYDSISKADLFKQKKIELG